jgi:Flp pilus assembly CpaE family ATPase
MLTTICSFKHSPGVTSIALGMARCWPRPLLLADLDPAGGDLAATLSTDTTPGSNLAEMLLALRRANTGASAAALWEQAHRLTSDGNLRLLPGVDDPAAADGLADGWHALARALTGPLIDDDGANVDVLADCGRLFDTSPVQSVLHAADVVVPVVASTVAGVRQAARSLPRLLQRLSTTGATADVRLLVRQGGPYAAQDVAEALQLPLLAAIPGDSKAAALVSGEVSGRLLRSPLWRTFAAVAAELAVDPLPVSADVVEPEPDAEGQLAEPTAGAA